MTTEIVKSSSVNKSLFSPDQFDMSMRMAKELSRSDFVPKDYKNNPANVLVAMQMGHEVGLSPMQSLQSIAVINGRPSLWGDAMMALVLSHPLCEFIEEKPILEGNSIFGYLCRVKRKGFPVHEVTFTIDDAKKAGLWGKQGPWSSYTNRMLQLRARGYALRNVFPDALKGISMAEEVRDYAVIENNPEQIKSKILEKFSEKTDPAQQNVIVIEEVKENSDDGLATKDQLGKLHTFISSLNITQATQSKWLERAGVDSLEKLDRDKIQSLIDMLENKNKKEL